MRGEELIAQAYRLAHATRRRPRQVDVNRALSSAYYALFHTLARVCADAIAGTGGDRSQAAWRQTYRALAHGTAKNACKQARNKAFRPKSSVLPKRSSTCRSFATRQTMIRLQRFAGPMWWR